MEANQREMRFQQVWSEPERLPEGYFGGGEIVVR